MLRELPESISNMRGLSVHDPHQSVRPEKRGVIPSVTHVDGSARPQTVEKIPTLCIGI